ncbi:MAG: PqqD family protein [Oscillospiraceae bacterium]|nr:PqqD family protein [Oscillospiraceae bacterium]
MKLKDGFLLREVAGQTVVLPTGSELNLNMMITLNETGKFLWEQMQNEISEDALVCALLAEYDVDEDRVRKSVEAFVAKLKNHELLA